MTSPPKEGGSQMLPPPRAGSAAVLLLHGLCANPLEMQPVARVLERDGYTVTNPLINGLGLDGDSMHTDWRSGSFEQWIAEAEHHLLALKQRHERVAVAGLCIGAVLALALAARTKVDAAVLISPTLFFDGWNVSPWRRFLPLAYMPFIRQRMSFAERAPYGVKNERLRRWLEQAMRSEGVSAAGAARLPAASLYEAERLIAHVKPLLPRLQTPALVMHALEDDVASPRSAHLLADQLGRTPRVEWYENSYHMLTLDNEREAVCASARRFIHEHLPRRPIQVPDDSTRRQTKAYA
jgi:carboxylesterase